jgi:RNA ligase (TIGR02306 family)
MSSLLVQVAALGEVKVHPRADALDVATLDGWQVVLKRGEFKTGDKVVYFPPDTVLPVATSDRFGVTKYLHSNGRVKSTRLRGEPSFGLVVKPDDPTWEIGRDVAVHYGATKYEPPTRFSQGDDERDHPLFQKYTEIENLRSFPDVLETGESVVVTEKIHGTNCRIGIIDGVRMAGSHRNRKKEAATTYWLPWKLEPVEALLFRRAQLHRQAILFGEVYGMQSLKYGCKGKYGFAAFDLLEDGRYMNWADLRDLCTKYGVRMVPDMGVIPFRLDLIRDAASGRTLVEGADHVREGVVIRPVVERTHPRVGRVILKYVGDDYMLSKHKDLEVE